jgi:AraC family transcriptional regulator of adaptative response/methylated-DNA-[protein]-cysteine methyltransferase
MPAKAELERATSQRDASYDGVFFVAVRTTGVFCRPSCPARKPLPVNVEYFTSAGQALAAGYRPCKRCRPLHTNGEPPKWVERLLGAVEGSPARRLSDADLRALAIDPACARRYFRRHFGMTFQAYQRGRRMGEALGALRRGARDVEVAVDHGYESNSGFRDAFSRTFGATPGRSADVQCIVSRLIESPLGPLMCAATEEGVCLVEFADRRALQTQVNTLCKRIGGTIVPGDNEHLEQFADELGRYFAGPLTEFTVSLVRPGTAFQQAVWDRLLEIPYGRTMSYGQLAREVGRPGAQRAVGRANGDNRLAIVVPCHRVVQSDGKLRGYGGGLWRKQFLLDHERNVVSGQLTLDL